MLRQKRLSALIMAVLILCAMSFRTYAYPVPDLSRKGSIKITMFYGGKAVPGGTMTLYRAGAVRESNGNYDFVLTGDFEDCGISLIDIQSPELTKELASYAAKTKLQGETQKIDGNGKCTFAELEPGLYLLVQAEAAKGYHNASPFLVSLPMLEAGEYVYDVQADPKIELTLTTVPSVTPGPVTTPTPGAVLTPTKAPTPGTTDTKLPQTGQLNWPVPVLAVVGLGMFSLGWILRYGKRNDDEK